MLMRPLYATLSNLIVLTEEVVTRPQFDRVSFRQRLAELAGEVRAADSRPAEDERVTQAAMVTMICLEQIRDDDKLSAQWSMVAGAMLPLLRTDAYAALQQERGMRHGG